MLRYADRITYTGASVVVLSLLVMSMLFKHDKHADDKPNMMARDRGAVVRESVREETPASIVQTPVATADEAPRAPLEVPRDDTAVNSEPARLERVTRQRTAETKKNVRGHEKRTATHRGAVVVAERKPTPAQTSAMRAEEAARPAPEQRKPLVSAAANTLDLPARDASNGNAYKTPAVEARASANELPAPARTAATPPVQAPANAGAMQTTSAPAHSVSAQTVRAPAYPVSTQAPKTRAEVQDELRKARMNGDLPRFGNPDPYGPGGVPSASP